MCNASCTSPTNLPQQPLGIKAERAREQNPLNNHKTNKNLCYLHISAVKNEWKGAWYVGWNRSDNMGNRLQNMFTKHREFEMIIKWNAWCVCFIYMWLVYDFLVFHYHFFLILLLFFYFSFIAFSSIFHLSFSLSVPRRLIVLFLSLFKFSFPTRILNLLVLSFCFILCRPHSVDPNRLRSSIFSISFWFGALPFVKL